MISGSDFYRQIKSWIIDEYNNSISQKPLIIGISGAQGIGKSTLCKALVETLSEKNIRAIHFSIDDLYLTRSEQVKLAATHKDNPYLQQRGYPGTHDVALGCQILKKIKQHTEVKIPAYDKSAHCGKGDRMPATQWQSVDPGKLDIVLFDGWLLGFTPVAPRLIADPFVDPALKIINENLADYHQWMRWIDSFIVLTPRRLDDVVTWRIEAEEKMKATGKSGMTRPETENYIKSFIPAYEMYLPELREIDPVKNHTLRFVIGHNRSPHV